MKSLNTERYIIRDEFFGGLLIDKKEMKFFYLNKNTYNLLSSNIDDNLAEKIKEKFGLRKLFDNKMRCNPNDFYKIKIPWGLSSPIRISVYPTLRCNLNCNFCYVKDIKKEYSRDMTFEGFTKILDLAKKLKVLEIEFLGGEPFLVNWIFKAIKLTYSEGLRVCFSTNGTRINEDICKELKKVDKLNISVSLEGDKKVHNKITNSESFDDVISAIENFNKFNIGYMISTTVSNDNISSLKRLGDILNDNGVKFWNLLFVETFEKGKELISLKNFLIKYREIKEYIKNKKYNINLSCECPFLFTTRKLNIPNNDLERIFYNCEINRKIEILPNGDSYPCCWFFNNRKYFLGNIFKESFEKLWKNKIRKTLVNNVGKECERDCKYSEVCNGCIGYSIKNKKRHDDRCPLLTGSTLPTLRHTFK